MPWVINRGPCVVVGPQRSHTRILAKMIARDTGREYIDEARFGQENWGEFLDKAKGDCVLQAPALTHKTKEMLEMGFSVFYVVREISDIKASEERIGWGYDRHEAEKFGKTSDSARAKYEFLSGIDHPNLVFLDPSFLREHPLWVDDREGFQWNQTHVDMPDAR